MYLISRSIPTAHTETVRGAEGLFLMAGAIIFETFRFGAFAKFITLVKLLPFRLLVRLLSVER
jgi:hypothetical protein